MKFHISNIAVLRSILTLLKKGMTKNQPLALIQATEDKGATITYTDYYRTSKILAIPATVERSGALCVDVMGLDKLITKLSKGKAIALFDCEETTSINPRLYIHCGKVSANLQGHNLNEFPVIVDRIDGVTHTATIPCSVLYRALESCAPIMSTDGNRINLCGLHFDTTVTGCDGHRLRTMPLPADVDLGGVIVPDSLIHVLRVALKGAQGGNAYIEHNGRTIAFNVAGDRFTGCLVDATYPNVAQVIPKQTGEGITINKAEFLNQLDVATVFASPKTHNVKITVGEDSMILIYACDPQLGEIECKVQGEDMSGPIVKAGYNWKYLKAAVSDIPDDQFRLCIIDTLSPTTITCDSEPNALHIVMPMRL